MTATRFIQEYAHFVLLPNSFGCDKCVFVSGTLTSKTAYGLNQMLKVVTKVLGQEHEEQGVCDSTGIIDYQHNTVDDHNVSGINKEQIRIESVILVGSFAAHLRLKNNC